MAATGYSSIQLLHSQVNTEAPGHNYSTDYDQNPDSHGVILFTGTDASIHEGQETPKVSKKLFNFDSLEVIGAQHAHTPNDHVLEPMSPDGKVNFWTVFAYQS